MNFINTLKRYVHGGDWKVLYKTEVMSEYKTLKGEKGYWYADPFLLFYKNQYYLFTEAFDKRKQIGKIAVSVFDKEKQEFGLPRVIIENKYHMSYPCVFEYKGDIYMIPEAGESNRLDIYKFTKFPYEWTKKTLIENVKYADSTIVFERQEVYLWAYDEQSNLTILYKLNIETNAIEKIYQCQYNERKYRPAGKIYQKNNVLYRPAQNCSKSYGGSLILRRVEDVLTLKESFLKEIFPSSIDIKYTKLHTYNTENEMQTIDVFMPSKGVHCLVENVKRKIHRIKMGQ